MLPSYGRDMKRVSLTALLALAMLAGASAFAGGERPVVVELYTSQGCDACPQADALQSNLIKRKGLIAMTLPVTYWDMLGWKDTLANEANTRRQKAYAAAMGRGGVYTPQTIVDGAKDVVGSREEDVEAAIDAEARVAAAVEVGFTPLPQRLHIAVAALPDGVAKRNLDATIWMFRLRSAVPVHIGAGENGGRNWTYRNVVSDIKELGRWNGRAVSIDLPPADAKTPAHDSVVVVLQQGGYGRVLGAAYLAHAERYAQQ